MPVAMGSEIYSVGVAPVTARGYKYSQAELDSAQTTEIPALLSDEQGQREASDYCANLTLTGFAQDQLKELLEPIAEEEHAKGWREGEALAEAWLIDHRACEFPWPFKRDLRHHRASLPGPEMIGIAGDVDSECVLAFGQVKTSKEDRFPPQVVDKGQKSLISQVLALRDGTNLKKATVMYLIHRARLAATEPWTRKFAKAITAYLESGKRRIVVFGVLVRDVTHNVRDLAGAVATLGIDCHDQTRLELIGLYLPTDSITEGPQHKPRKKKEDEK